MTLSSTSMIARFPTNLDWPLILFRTAAYPRYAVYLVVSLIFVVALWNVLALILAHISVRRGRASAGSQRNNERKELERQAGLGNRRPDLRRAPRALLSGVRVLAFRVTLPAFLGHFPLVEVIVSLGYLLALLVFEFVKARDLTTGALDPMYWANRAATLAVSQLTFIVALSGKNNIISVLTGISYEKLNVLHRAASRVVVLLIWVHLWGRWRIGLTGAYALSNNWVRSGALSASALTLAAILGSRPLRNRAYDLFLAGHVILVFIFLLAGYYHVKHTVVFFNYAWPPFVIWGLDRFLRLARVLHTRYLSARAPSNRTPNCMGNAVLEVLSPDTLRVALRIADSRLLWWKAGQSAYLTVPTVSHVPLEAHPFTIASIDVPVVSSSPGKKELEMMFIIRARRGFTRRLHEYAMQRGRNCRVSAFVDGPYGAPPDLSAFRKVVLIAGGSGVSFTLPLLLDLARRARRTPRDALCKRVLFVWLVRERSHASWIDHELSTLAESAPDAVGLNVDVRVFVTGASAGVESGMVIPTLVKPTMNEKSLSFSGEATPAGVETYNATFESPGSSSGAGSDEDGKTNLTHTRVAENSLVTLSVGRPSVARMLEDELCAEAKAEEAGVCVSGPNTLIADVRAALRSPRVAGPRAVLRGDAPGVFLHVEHFGM